MSSETAVDALFRQTGVIRVDTLEQLFDVAQVLALQPLPQGRRVAIVGNAGGPGILAADACEAAGLGVPELSEETQRALRAFLPPVAAVTNPIDLIASATADEYRRALELVLADDGVDAVIAIFVPPLVTRPDDVARAIAAVATTGNRKPIVANFLAMGSAPEALAAVPTFAYPETAVLALARAADYAAWRRRPEGTIAELEGVDTEAGAAVATRVLVEHPEGVWLGAAEAVALLRAFGIPTVDTVVASSAEGAVSATEAMGFPVAMKTADPSIVHKSDIGAVRLGLGDASAVREAYAAIAAATGNASPEVVVQRMAEGGVETIIGVVQDPAFGPLVMFGMGGTAVELMQDRAFRILPLTDVDAHELVRAPRGSALLFGYRGSEPCDTGALEELLLRVALLAEALPQIAELDLNPVIATPGGVVVVDAKVRVVPYERHPELAVRRLR